ncbi:hypothetical protein CTEN210_05433 [Chaetoceros tenuissimus]|uniref:Uncharacterized protein n=1 Tax=Chaetoceros tenuissimus TaxID=426638 RepID=A0AAD3CMY8_9STRA|nr:hypothetical protein CTEN210_05433 [Chaetoceros tenuissimus]
MNLYLRNPNPHSPSDEIALNLIRRANLDMLWGRDSSTVSSAYGQMLQLKKMSSNLGLLVSRDKMGPWPIEDCSGVETAMLMLWKSLDKGQKGRNYCQFDTIRKIRSLRENIHSGSINGLLSNVAFTDQRGRVFHMDKSPMHTKWFQLFSKGCESRMENSTSQDAALSVEAMLAMLELLWKSLDKGQKGRNYCQFDTIRKIRSLRENIHSGSINGLLSNVAFTDQRGRVFHMDKSPMHTKWFQLFSKGCKSRMENSTSQDAALSVEAMLAMLELLELRVQRTSTSKEERRMAVMIAAVLVVGFCAALRGGEIMLVEATEFCRRIDAGRVESTQHVLVPLMG